MKIRDRERNEPPHVTILHKRRAWRFDLRSGRFLDQDPDPKGVPEEVIATIKANGGLLQQKWDEMYPENPIESTEVGDD